MDGPRLALVHDWLVSMRGGEKVLESLCRLWPDAAIHTVFARRKALSPLLQRRRICTSPLQRVPRIERWYQALLPLLPLAMRSLRVGDVDLVLSVSHCVAKAVPLPPGVPHLCYCNTPMRYAWHLRETYLERLPTALRPLAREMLRWLRGWDRDTAANVTWFIANSENIRERIADAYSRDSVVVYPPVDTDYYTPARIKREQYYLAVSALVPYKRIDLAVLACQRLRRPLVVIGDGEEIRRLRGLAGPMTTFLGRQPNAVIRDHLRRCQALLFPGEEDFGIVPVEANACGTPVIAFGQGGATETIVPLESAAEPTGLWFAEQSIDSLVEAIRLFERRRGDIHPIACRRQALRFSTPIFEQRMRQVVDQALTGQPLAGSLFATSQPARRRIAA